MKKITLLEKIGFVFDVTEEVVEKLEAKTTKTSKNVLDRINLHDYYRIVSNGEQFTVLAERVITQAEVKQFATILKQEYIKAGTVADKNGIWERWIEATL